MKNTVFGVWLIIAIPGCMSSHESAIRDGLRSLNELTDLLNTIADGQSAKEAQPKLKVLFVHLRELKYRLNRQTKSAWEQKEDLTDKYHAEYRDALQRFRKALAKSLSDVEAARVISKIIDEELPDLPER